MDSLPLLAIITPCYNEAEYITDNIESVFNQSYPNVEHIIVDGGSDDGTIDIIEQYQNKYNIRYITEPDDGISEALNRGLEMAEGEWIGWQNANDYYTEGAFSMFSDRLCEHPDADMIYGDTSIINEDGEEINRNFAYPPSTFIQRHWSNWASNQSAFFRKKMILELGGFDTDLEYTMDSGLLWDLLHSRNGYKIVQTHSILGAFRIHRDAATYGETDSSESVYEYPLVEQIVPESVWTTLAKAGKGYHLLRQGRVDALRYKMFNDA